MSREIKATVNQAKLCPNGEYMVVMFIREKVERGEEVTITLETVGETA